MKKIRTMLLIILAIVLLTAGFSFAATVIKKGGNVYIEDRNGELWDVTQAQTLGFNPHGFQYGIGKNAFTPLQDEDLEENRVSSEFNTRVIGISMDNDAHAYSVNRLTRHEIANTTIAGEAIVAGY